MPPGCNQLREGCKRFLFHPLNLVNLGLIAGLSESWPTNPIWRFHSQLLTLPLALTIAIVLLGEVLLLALAS